MDEMLDLSPIVDGPGGPTCDRRTLRTRAALLSAFNTLVLTKDYDDFGPVDIAKLANVGRSTFYKHFSSKNDLFRHSLMPLLAPIAGLVDSEKLDPEVQSTLEHLWQNRIVGRMIISGSAGNVMVAVLADLTRERLRSSFLSPAAPGPWLDYAGLQIAHGTMGVLHAWLAGRKHLDPASLAEALHATTRAMARISLSLSAEQKE